ncbi:histidine kinase [Aquicoccus sp. SCR17]|nr:histidine kinase [Carideicomes alvinocaridis]
MTGKILAAVIVVAALATGIAIYYLQVYAFYDEVEPQGEGDVMLTSVLTGMPEPIAHSDFRAIDSDSSPIRYRACFTAREGLPLLTEAYRLHDDPKPRVAPSWFDCFDADRIGEDLEAGRAVAFTGQENVHYGIDRIVAIYPDGRGYAWHEINRCGEEVFDGKPAPEGCPTPPAE